ncbi:MAG TPA: SDR family NAD(P)-dependent oxidoreductase [Solirubrobacteraceae bacterium]|jgi:short-subunit dehydrogenase|nr:SDR family NAD(P)-dependent oxidoreductase [Solirubrobacteraceae bacterium]
MPHGAPELDLASRPPRSFVALITGASSGIGEATARRIALEPGAAVVLVARREERLRALAATLGAPASFIVADLLDEQAPARIRAYVEQRFGRLDLLVNNAGRNSRATFAAGGYEEVRSTMAINFDAQVRLAEELLALLRSSAPSAIVNVSSMAARLPTPGTGAYCASKAALAGWSDALRAEERGQGVHVGLVLPGSIPTESFPQIELLSKPQTRWMVSTAERVAEAICDAGIRRRRERYAPRPFALGAVLRVLAPSLSGALQERLAADLPGEEAGAEPAQSHVAWSAPGPSRADARA